MSLANWFEEKQQDELIEPFMEKATNHFVFSEEDKQILSDEEQVLSEEDEQLIHKKKQVFYENEQVFFEDEQILNKNEQVLSEEDEQVLSEEDEQVLSEEDEQLIHKKKQVFYENEQVFFEDEQILSEEDEQILNKNEQILSEEDEQVLSEDKNAEPEPIDRDKGVWVQCENCESILYVKLLKKNQSICEECGYHLQMGSTERIDLLIDSDTWFPMDEDMVARDVLDFNDDKPYKDRIASYQEQTGLTDAVQTGIGKLNGVSVALGVMDFKFMGGSMGSVVGEKITRLIEYATKESMPLIIVCASGGARMQEGILSLMQMAKISSALQIHQLQKGLLYISILTYPTTGGVTASFGMLGDIIIAEPNAYIAFAGKRVIEQTLNQKIPDGFQVAESLFDHGSLDLIVPRKLLKSVLSEIFELYNSPLRRVSI